MNMSIGKFIGCVMMVIGSAIGGGILMIPTCSAAPGFTLCAISAIAGWVLLTITGLLVLEMSLALPENACTFFSMAEKTLGKFGRVITWLSLLILLYSSLVAYISGESTLIPGVCESFLNIHISSGLAVGIFMLIFGGAVFWSTKAVDDFNRGLFSIKGLLLLAAIFLMLPHVSIQNLIYSHGIEHSKYLWAASPTLFCIIFNFHFVIPSLRKYVGNKPTELKWIIISGTTISLIIYLLWMIGTLGAVPVAGELSFTSLTGLGHDPSTHEVAQLISMAINNKWVTASLHGFVNVAVTTSFLGVSLGLFDALAEGFNRPNTRFGRFQTSILTFTPPLLIVFVFPHVFQKAMNWSACATAVLCIILPAAMVYKLRKSKELNSTYRAWGNNALFIILVIIGLIFTAIPALINFGMLPVLGK